MRIFRSSKPTTSKVQTAIAAIFLVLVVFMFLPGCIGQEEEPETTTIVTTEEGKVTTIVTTMTTQIPTDLTTYIFGFSSDPSSLDPSVVFDDSSIQMGRVYETLVHVASDMTVEPALASSWDVSEDGLTWTFNLRQGVKFHDGSDFDAEAVKFSFERTLEMNKGAAYILLVVDSMEVTDKYTIKFTLTDPSPFDYIVGSQYGAYIMSPSYVREHEVDGDLGQAWLAEHTSGTGPYMLTEWIHGQQITLQKFDDYWGGWEGKHVDTVIIRVIRDTSTAAILLAEGKLDSTWTLPFETVDAVRDNADYIVVDSPTLHTLYWRINTKKPPTNDLNVRKALNYAFPYDEVIEAAFLGRYGERLYGPLPKGIWGYDDDPPLKYEFDLAKAADFLTLAGYPDGLPEPIDLYYYSANDPQRRMAELYKSKLAEIGVTLNARAFPFDELLALSCCDPEGGPHLSAHDWWPTFTDPFDFLYGCWGTDQFFNWAFWENSEFDDLVLEANALSVVDRETAITKYKEAQRMILEAANTIYLAEIKGVSVHRAWVHGWVFNFNYDHVVDYYSIYKE